MDCGFMVSAWGGSRDIPNYWDWIKKKIQTKKGNNSTKLIPEKANEIIKWSDCNGVDLTENYCRILYLILVIAMPIIEQLIAIEKKGENLFIPNKIQIKSKTNKNDFFCLLSLIVQRFFIG